MHTELIAYSATAPSTGAAASAVTGSSLTVKNSKTAASILAIWAKNQTAGYHQLTFPSGHDTTRGARMVAANTVDILTPLGIMVDVQPQELLSVSIAGSASAGDVESGCMLLNYDDLPGVNARRLSWSELVKRYDKFVTVQATLTGAAAGFTGAELITSESDLLRANQDYAVLGIETNTDCAAVCLKGPDTGYVRVGVPGISGRRNVTGNFFAMLSQIYGDKPLIPIINSGNKSDTYLDFVQDENNISPVVSVNLVLLK